MPRLLLFATTTGYQTRMFGDAAHRLGVELVFATDRCHMIDDPWRDGAIPIRFHEEDASVAAVINAVRPRPVDGILVVGDRPTIIGARVAELLQLPWHPPAAAAAARSKLRTRERFRDAGLPVPWFDVLDLAGASEQHVRRMAPPFPCVVKPLGLSGSRGVMRADDPPSLVAAVDRLRALLNQPDVRAERDDIHQHAIVESFIPGHEYAVDAVLDRGVLHPLAIFDKPDPLDGPFFEETIYVTPPPLSADATGALLDGVTRAAAALGLYHGPIHAECRVNERGVFVLEVAARPIGGLCARAVRLQSAICNLQSAVSLEEALLRFAIGESPASWHRETDASGVMMIPIPRRGLLRGVHGEDDARGVAGIDDVRITAKPDQLLVPLPEGASYLGFIFARAHDAVGVERALRAAHARLSFEIDPEIPMRALDTIDGRD